MKKNRDGRNKSIIYTFLNTGVFKLIYILLIIAAFYAAANRESTTGYFLAVYYTLKNPWVLCILMICIFIMTIYFVQYYQKKYHIMIRSGNRTKNLKDMTYYVVILSLIILIVFFFLASIVLMIKCSGNFNITNVNGINVLGLIAFDIIKIVFFFILLALIVLYVQNITNIAWTAGVAVLIMVFLFWTPSNVTSNQQTFSPIYASYLVNYESTNLSSDITNTLLMTLLLMIICYTLFQYAKKSKNDLG